MKSTKLSLLSLIILTSQLPARAQSVAPGSCYRNVVDSAHSLFQIGREHALKNDYARYICFEATMQVELVDYYHSSSFFHESKNVERLHFLRDDVRQALVQGNQISFEIKGAMPSTPGLLMMDGKYVFKGRIQGDSIEGTASVVGTVMDLKKLMDGGMPASTELERKAIRLELETDAAILADIRKKK